MQKHLIASDWDFFVRENGGAPLFFMVDLALRLYVPIERQPICISVHVSLLDPDEYGLTRGYEAETLFVLEDLLARQMASFPGAVYAGRITGASRRSFFFYSQNADAARLAIQEVLDEFPDYTAAIETRNDPEWTFFLNELYPVPWEEALIRQRRMQETG